jgi:hypothetical protein
MIELLRMPVSSERTTGEYEILKGFRRILDEILIE